jgi:protoporphyrinogen oxidase
MSERIGIVGGGLLGMAIAHRLRRQGHAVTLLEAAPQLGGLASAWKLGGIAWDKFYHVILGSDAHTQALLKELGLADRFRSVQTRTGFYTDGKLHSMSNSIEFLKFPPLGLVGKLRLALTIVHASRVKDWKPLERVPVADWLTKWSGTRTFEKIWRPLLRAKLGENYRESSAAFIWATIQRMYAARRSGMKTEQFGYVTGGYATILDRFAQVLHEGGVTVRTNAPVANIAAGPAVELANGERLDFDRVVCTAAAPLIPKLMPGLPEVERGRWKAVKYQGIVCASLLLAKPLADFYVTNITESWVPFTAVIEMSALVDRAEFGGKHLVYLPKYVMSDDPLLNEPDGAIRESFLAALERMYPHFQRSDVLAFEVARVKYVFPIPTIGYSERLPGFETGLPGVCVANSAHIVNGTLNVNETLALAERFVGWVEPRLQPVRKTQVAMAPQPVRDPTCSGIPQDVGSRTG